MFLSPKSLVHWQGIPIAVSRVKSKLLKEKEEQTFISYSVSMPDTAPGTFHAWSWRFHGWSPDPCSYAGLQWPESLAFSDHNLQGSQVHTFAHTSLYLENPCPASVRSSRRITNAPPATKSPQRLLAVPSVSSTFPTVHTSVCQVAGSRPAQGLWMLCWLIPVWET